MCPGWLLRKTILEVFSDQRISCYRKLSRGARCIKIGNGPLIKRSTNWVFLSKNCNFVLAKSLEEKWKLQHDSPRRKVNLNIFFFFLQKGNYLFAWKTRKKPRSMTTMRLELTKWSICIALIVWSLLITLWLSCNPFPLNAS